MTHWGACVGLAFPLRTGPCVVNVKSTLKSIRYILFLFPGGRVIWVFPENLEAGMLILVLKDIFQVLVLGGQVLVLVLGGQVLVLVGQVLVLILVV